ncbi:MAG TPA: GNAT family N-acetyltransferase [Umezawaea sp.]|nr:GNAT family N-acetyltransferase [Umezawaea sp.]
METLFDDVVIRRATTGEEETVLDLLAEAAAWLHGRGIDQWPARFPADPVRRQIAAGEAYLVSRAGQPVATVTVAESDPMIWGVDSEPAYYVGRLAVSRTATGLRLGYRVLDWVEANAARRGWHRVRLATASDNPALQGYYERVGFQHVADPLHAPWPTWLYEREVGASRSTPVDPHEVVGPPR